jgi:antirestriction protein
VSGFLVGEPTTHNKDGEPVYASFFRCDDWYGRGADMTVKQFLVEIEKSEQELRENEETPDHIQTELDLIADHGQEAVDAYHALRIESNHALNDFEESYVGKFESDIEFARDHAENIEANISQSWPHYCIDWEYAARELMMDYSEQDGHYFRHI